MKHFSVRLSRLIGEEEAFKVFRMNWNEITKWFNENREKLRKIVQGKSEVKNIIYDEIIKAESELAFDMYYRGKYEI